VTANPATYVADPEALAAESAEPGAAATESITADPVASAVSASASAAAASLERSVAALKGRQHQEGWWKGELETNVTMDAEDLMLRQFLGIRTERQTAGAARWIRSRQRDDGTWATYYGGPPDLSTTIEAYVALRLAGDGVEEPHMRRASTYIRQEGGIGASRVFTRFWLALFGQWPWERLPVMPPELMLLPPSIPLNIYDFASCTPMSGAPCAPCAGSRSGPPSAGSSSARRPMVHGGASSRRGSTRSWRCTCRATPWTTP
jgi:squalene-hopene/tetraprenyl-beta-curcumene cyclase